jgi:alpha-amylase/alpha-mannosidase (GH57 family)
MKRRLFLMYVIIIASLVLSACGGQVVPEATPTAEQQLPEATPVVEEEPLPLYLNLIWHQHQPLYYKDSDGIYTRPWVRVHATKDYYDMASMVAEYPDVHITFNLTPVLLRQLDDFVSNAAKDQYWVLSEKKASDLLPEEKQFILERFFDANWDNMIAFYPRYQALLDKRGSSDPADIQAALETFTEQDYRDLQIWFNLVWMDPDFLAVDPLKILVDKGEGFDETDKLVLFTEAYRIMSEIVPLHKSMQDSGQIEVITTPYAHPILPLIYDTNLALTGNPDAKMPVRYVHPEDSIAHLDKSVEIYTNTFGQVPRGLWPGEGSVAEEIVSLVSKAGYQWMATGEQVLEQSLEISGFTRDSKDTIQQADVLYRPYYVQRGDTDPVAVFFRDHVISDKIGFTYGGMSGKAAAEDLVQRLENIQARLIEEDSEGPHIVSIIVDGENAWEYYPNDGKEFFNNLYGLLSEHETIQTITPSEYLKLYPEQREIETLFPGAWFSPNYDTWIGESEEQLAWNYLGQTRDLLEKYIPKREGLPGTKETTPEALELAKDFMYLAEGSDWFWWYGTDQDSGQDEYFDTGFRSLLRSVYVSLGEPVPAFIDVPIIPTRPETPAMAFQGLSTPDVDGQGGETAWDTAAVYTSEDQGLAFAYTMDKENIYLKLESSTGFDTGQFGFYFKSPVAVNSYPFALESEKSLLGIAASHLFQVENGILNAYAANEDGWILQEEIGIAITTSNVIEVAIPLSALGELEAGDDIRLVSMITDETLQRIPETGPAQILFPDLGLTTQVLFVEDPTGDDFGPGNYVYPTDSVFQSKIFDIHSFEVSYDENNIVFKIALNGVINNAWGSPNNLSLQTIDVYVDKDPGAGTGARMLLPGRNAALTEGNGWDVAVWAEGWTPDILIPDPETNAPISANVSYKIIVDPTEQAVTLRVPKTVFGDGDPTQWGYVAIVMSQEGYPAAGVWRVRDIESESEQWRFGGGAEDNNHTRIIDMAWPADGTPDQAEMLRSYPSSQESIDDLSPDDYAQLELLIVE